MAGRLGEPQQTLCADPRTHAAVRQLMLSLNCGLDRFQPPPGTETVHMPLEQLHAAVASKEAMSEMLFDGMCKMAPPVPGVVDSVQHITGPDGNRIDLFISRPEAPRDRAQTPCVLYLHGGAMVTLRADGANYRRFRHLVASRGRLSCIGVEFRNAAGALGCHPFPAALNDCMAALAWAHSHLEQLGASHVVLAGESGGANLAFASALRAKREGTLGSIAGVFGMCPYIFGDYAAPPPDLPSMVENDGYGISIEMGAARARLYDPSGEHARDPLAWPYWATQNELTGLPPHCISVAELDPHRDEGVACFRYFRELNAAGVDASARTVLGVNHGWEIFGLGLVAPRLTLETVDHLASFVHSLGA